MCTSYINWGQGLTGGKAKHIDLGSSTINGVTTFMLLSISLLTADSLGKKTQQHVLFFALQVCPGMDRLMRPPAATDSNRVL